MGIFDDGAEFDNYTSHGKLLVFTVGSGMVVSVFDAAVERMEVGEKK